MEENCGQPMLRLGAKGLYIYVKHQPVRQDQTTTPGTTCPTLLDESPSRVTSKPETFYDSRPLVSEMLYVHWKPTWKEYYTIQLRLGQDF